MRQRPLSINFAWRRGRETKRIGFLLLALAISVGLWVGQHEAERLQTLDSLRIERQGLHLGPDAPRAVALSPEGIERQRAELKMAQGVIEHLDTPWGALFAAVESAFDDQVTLLNVETEPERREARLTAEAKDLQAMQTYVRQLRQSPALKDVYLASHQINQQDPLRPVRFVANARWVVPAESDPGAAEAANAKESTDPSTPKEISVSSIPTVIPDTGEANASGPVSTGAKKAGE